MQICSRKINEKFLEEDDFQEQKVQFHELMIAYFLHESDYLKTCDAYRRILETKCVADDESRSTPVLKHYILYLCMSKREDKQVEMLDKVLNFKMFLNRH